jgi:hypothetical protein
MTLSSVFLNEGVRGGMLGCGLGRSAGLLPGRLLGCDGQVSISLIFFSVFISPIVYFLF